MLLTRHFAFVHVPKTGGSFVRRVLVERLPPEWFVQLPPTRHQHQGWDDLPPAAAGLPVLAFVRNPWDWYVSWYHYHVQLSHEIARGAFFRMVFANGSNSFSEAVRNACTGNFEHPDGHILQTARELDVDFYTARVLNMLGPGFEDARLTVGRFERLVEDLGDFLSARRTDPPRLSSAAALARAGERKQTRLLSRLLRCVAGRAGPPAFAAAPGAIRV